MGHLLTRLDAPFCMVMLDTVTEELRATLAAMTRDRSFRVLYSDGSPATAAAILAELRAGAMVGMMGDRVVAGGSVPVPFLSGTAEFPVGPYLLAAAAGAPLIQVFAIRRGWRRYSFHAVTQLAPAMVGGGGSAGGRRQRRRELAAAAAGFAAELEQVVRAHPHQWGNFYDFWAASPAEAAPSDAAGTTR
jgi:predicted LPLAT superfamily acyltransferase